MTGEIDSLIGWWNDAGVDTIVGDRPQSWLDQPAKAPPPTAEPRQQARAEPMPGDLEAFRRWLRESDIVPAPAAARVDAAGDPASGLMLLVDMPEPGDAEQGALVGGEAGRLLDRMLAAIGRDRASVYVAAMSPAHAPGGTVGEPLIERLAAAARHHVALAAPKWLLLLGDAPSRAFCEANLIEARGRQYNFNHGSGTVSAVATFHPRFLLRQPALKAESWRDLRMLNEGMSA